MRRRIGRLAMSSGRAKSGVTMPMQMAPVSSEMGGVRWRMARRDGGDVTASRAGEAEAGAEAGAGRRWRRRRGRVVREAATRAAEGGVHGSGGAVDGGSSVGSGGSGMDGGSTAGAPAAMSDGSCGGGSGGVGACGMCLNAHVPVYTPGETSTLYPPHSAHMCAHGGRPPTPSRSLRIISCRCHPLHRWGPAPRPTRSFVAPMSRCRSMRTHVQRVADRSQPRRVEQAIHAPRPAASRAGGAEDPNGGVAAGFYDAALAAVPTGALTSCARANAATAAVAAADRAAADAANAAAAAAAASVAATDAAMALAGPPAPSVDEAFPTGRSGGRSGGAGCGGVGGGDANHAATHPASPPRFPLPRPPRRCAPPQTQRSLSRCPRGVERRRRLTLCPHTVAKPTRLPSSSYGPSVSSAVPAALVAANGRHHPRRRRETRSPHSSRLATASRTRRPLDRSQAARARPPS